MTNFIAVTEASKDKTVYINPANITYFFASGPHETIIRFIGRDASALRVAATPDDIMALVRIANAERA